MGSALNTFFYFKEAFFTEKRFRTSNWQSAQKVHKKRHEKFFHFTDTNVCKNSISLFHFFIWLSVKCKDFLMISNLYQIVHVFSLLHKDKLKAQERKCNMSVVHYHDVLLCCTLSRKVLVTVFRHKTVNSTSFKKWNICATLQSWMLRCTFRFFHFFTNKATKKDYWTISKCLKKFL